MADPISVCLESLKSGHLVLLVDDVSEDTRCFLIQSAVFTSEQNVSLIVNRARGIICVALPEKRCSELRLSPMNRAPLGSYLPSSPLSLTVSVEARSGVTTGISAHDRARTIQALATTSHPHLDLVMPGHIFPVATSNGGTLVTNSIWEAAVDLVREAGLAEAAVICHCLDEKGESADYLSALKFTSDLGIPTINLSQVVQYRLGRESIVSRITSTTIPSFDFGPFRTVAFQSHIDQAEHLALIKGEIDQVDPCSGLQEPILVRVQAENRIGDLLGPASIPTRQRLVRSLSEITARDRGILVYVRHPHRGQLCQIVNNLASQKNSSTVKATQIRSYGVGLQILRELGAHRIRLLTNRGAPILGVEAFGIDIVETVPFNLKKENFP